jgi:hypothetical protein
MRVRDGFSEARSNYLSVRCVPFSAPYTARFSVSYGENRRSDSVGQDRLHALRSLLHFKLDTKGWRQNNFTYFVYTFFCVGCNLNMKRGVIELLK